MSIDAPLALAFTAGLVATVNPCGFAMLPAYLSFFVGAEDSSDRDGNLPVRLARALLVGVVVSGGFLVVFALTGLAVSVGLEQVRRLVPWIAVGVGIAVTVLGLAMLAGREVNVNLPKLERGGGTRSLGSIFLFGVSYAIASLSCALPVFLVVVSGTITETNVLSGFAAFAAYAAGMSLVLLVLTIAVALARDSLVRRLRASMRHVQRASGVLLVLAGMYLTYYWLDAQLGDGGGVASDLVYRWSFDLSARIQEQGGSRLGAALLAIVLAVASIAFAGRARTEVQAGRAGRPGVR